jgi:NAD(P)-dependent dehydrogenase (short-subunit alcohol dehydrogenase family)
MASQMNEERRVAMKDGVTGAGRLAGRAVAITGAASGIGLAAALACAEQGAAVALLDRDEEAVQRVAREFPLDGSVVLTVPMDLSDGDSVHRAFGAVHDAYGRLDGLFNNAGVAPRNESGRIEDISDAQWELALQVNLTGCFLCCREAVPLMEASGGGTIVNNASTAALIAEPGLEAYSAAKGGVVALTRSLAMSCADRGIRVNAVCPGLVRTPMAAAVGNELVSRLTAATPLPVPGPEAVAGLIVYLLSHESEYMTGSTVVIDGGLTSH